MQQSIRRTRWKPFAATLMVLFGVFTNQAHGDTTITIGKGSGILWEGLPFSVSGTIDQSGELNRPSMGFPYIALTAANSPGGGYLSQCQPNRYFSEISGIKVFTIAPGLGIVPRAVVNGTFTRKWSSSPTTMIGTIGLPKTAGTFNGSPGFIPPDFDFCLSPTAGANDQAYFQTKSKRTINASGTWVLVGDGSQKSSEIFITGAIGMGAPHYGGSPWWSNSNILPNNLKIRISTLECSIATSQNIDFGVVKRNSTLNAELARQSHGLSVQCSQNSDRIHANINVQARGISGLYQGTPTRLALNQGGGYITGEISDNATGSGACMADAGLRFDNTQVKIGEINASEQSKAYHKQITWRLCSGGSDLPVGKVSASADMLVTFN